MEWKSVPVGDRLYAAAHDITDTLVQQEALKEANDTLERRVQEEVAKNREKDHLIIQQSRLAAMGEMIHNIAHQWRQPLSALSAIIMNIKDDYEYNELTAESLARDTEKAKILLKKMSTTIDDFRDFFRPDKEPSEFEISKSIDEAIFVMEASLNACVRVVEKKGSKCWE